MRSFSSPKQFVFRTILCLFAVGIGFVSAQAEEEKTVLRVLSYNIQIGRGPGGSYSNPEEAFLARTAHAVSKLNPDIAGLQEVDRRTNRSGKDEDQLAILGEKLGMESFFEWKIELPGGHYGVGTLTREKPVKTSKVLMKGRAHTRVLQICEFEKYVFFNTHFPLTEPLRLEAVRTIEKEAEKYTKPIILAGDFNAHPDSPVVSELRRTWRQISADAPTYPANAPNRQIDYLFIRNAPNARVTESFIADEPEASDHCPVFCEIEF